MFVLAPGSDLQPSIIRMRRAIVRIEMKMLLSGLDLAMASSFRGRLAGQSISLFGRSRLGDSGVFGKTDWSATVPGCHRLQARTLALQSGLLARKELD